MLDGEIVAPDPATGLSSFARLQQRMHLRDVQRAARTGVSVELYLFDCLFYEGIDLGGLPLLDRKKVLRDVVWYDHPIHFTPYRTTGSAAMYRDACAKGAEGIIAKRAESRYVSGRSADWLKIKCVQQQEFVIGGYTEPTAGSPRAPGALLQYGGTTTAAGCATRARWAPATITARWSSSPRSWSPCTAAPHHSLPVRSRQERCSGSPRSWSRRSVSENGPKRGCSGTRVPRTSGRQGGPRGTAGRLTSRRAGVPALRATSQPIAAPSQCRKAHPCGSRRPTSRLARLTDLLTGAARFLPLRPPPPFVPIREAACPLARGCSPSPSPPWP